MELDDFGLRIADFYLEIRKLAFALCLLLCLYAGLLRTTVNGRLTTDHLVLYNPIDRA